MRVLLSAITCQPDVGSEPKVGWDAAMAISELHDCHVVTHVAGRKSIEQKQAEGIATRVKFHYFGEQFTWHPSRFIARLQSWIIFQKWQARLLPFAAQLHRQHNFHLSHHVTYVTWRVASPLWQLPIPFVWGPIGGTAVIPRNFLGMLSRPAIAFEAARYVSGRLASRSKGFRSCVENAALVVAANEETETFFRHFRPSQPVARLWPVFFTPAQVASLREPLRPKPDDRRPLRLFAGGNMEGRKGIALALEAIAALKNLGVPVTYTFAGWGPELKPMQKLAHRLGISDQVEFHPGFSREPYIAQLKDSDAYFLPSFRETSPITLLEAAMAGCYPVVADSSGAGEIVRRIGGAAAPAQSRGQIVADLVERLQWCDRNRAEMRGAAQAASDNVASEFSQEHYLKTIDGLYSSVVDHAA